MGHITNGIHNGFHLGCNRQTHHHATTRNLKSAYEHPEVVDAYLARECQLGRVQRFPITSMPPLPELSTSTIGVIPKRGQLNKWRLIVDLSSPKGTSVNDGISSSLCSLSYASLDDAVQMLLTLGKNALLAKLDLKHAYRVVPVHPQDCPLLCMSWKEKVFLD